MAKGLPLDDAVIDLLTDEEIRQIEEEEGEWCISGIELLTENNVDYNQIITDSLESIGYDDEITRIAICGGLDHINQPVALVMNTQEVDLLIPLYDLQVDGSEKQIENIKPASAEKEDAVYLYEGIKDAVNSMDELDGNETGASGYIVLAKTSHIVNYSTIIITMVFISFVFYNLKKIRRKV